MKPSKMPPNETKQSAFKLNQAKCLPIRPSKVPSNETKQSAFNEAKQSAFQ